MVASDVVVVDTSLVFKWLFEEDDSDLARDLAQHWADEGIQVAAPCLLTSELANALHRRVVKDKMTAGEVARSIENLLASTVELHHVPQLTRRSLELASQLEQDAVYDSLYLALAESLDCYLWTADNRFYRAAREHYENVRRLGDPVSPE